MVLILWLLAVVLVVVGVVRVLAGEVLFGVALIVVGCLIGQCGVSVLR